jgi:chromosome segregation ATPase
VLQSAAMQQRTASVAAQDEIVRLQNENASLSDRLALALQDIENSSARIKAMQTTLDTRDANAASALAQINHLSSELTVASAERFKLVATVYGEKRRQNQKASFWEDKVKAAEARAATRKAQVEHLEEVRREYDKRIHLLEALLESERDVAQRRLSQLPT